MPQPPMIIFDNLIDLTDTMITASNEVTALPKENLLDDRLAKVSRLGGVSSQFWRFALGSQEFVSVIAILGHNFSFNATVTITGYSDAFLNSVITKTENAWLPLWGAGELGAGEDGAGGSPTSKLTANRTSIVLIFIPQTRAQWWEVEVNDPANAAGYLEAGRIFLGRFFQFARYPVFPERKKTQDRSKKVENELGGVSFNVIAGKKKKTYSFTKILTSEHRRFEELQRDFGIHKPFIFLINPDKSDSDYYLELMYSTMISTDDIVRRNNMFWKTNLNLLEF